MGEDAEPQGPELLLGAARGERGAECALDAAEDTLHVGALPIAAARKALRGTPALRGAGELVRVAATIERDDRARQDYEDFTTEPRALLSRGAAPVRGARCCGRGREARGPGAAAGGDARRAWRRACA